MHRTILFYEDDLAIRELVTALLEDSGYRVLDAASLSDAERTISCAHVDLFLTDSETHGRSTAMQVFERLCKDVGRDLPVVLFTAHNIPREQAQEWGCADSIQKPFDIDELLQRIEANLPHPA